MSDQPSFEARFGAGYERFLQGAPVAVDAAALAAAVVGSTPQPVPTARRPIRSWRGAIAVLVAAVAVAGAVAIGSRFLVVPPVPQPSLVPPSPTLAASPDDAQSPSPSATDGVPAGLSGRIVIPTGIGMYASNPDGGWTFLEVHGGCPALSPDGRYLAYDGFTDGGESALFVADPDGRNERLLWVGELDESLTGVRWLPDGRSVSVDAYRDEDPGTARLAIGHLDGSPATVLPDHRDYPGGREFLQIPSWSPDGERMAIHAARPATEDDKIVIRSVSGETLRRIDTPGFVWDVAWAPQGDVIAYTASSRQLGPKAIHLVRPDGTGDVVIGRASHNRGYSDLAWSPDGSRLAAVNDDWETLRTSVELYDHDGAHVDQLVDLDAHLPIYLSWSPDGRTVLLTSGPTESPYLVSLTGELRELPAPEGYGVLCPVTWGPATP